jgi:hypothetical protein
MTPAERRLLALIARRTLAIGLGCRTSSCPLAGTPAEPGPGFDCPRLELCVEEGNQLKNLIQEAGLEVPNVRSIG